MLGRAPRRELEAPSVANRQIGKDVQETCATDSFGDRKVKAHASAMHPLEQMERNKGRETIRQEMTMATKLGGQALAQRMCLEMQAASRVGRMAGLPSSNMMLDTLLGDDECISFDDYLRPSEFDEQLPPMVRRPAADEGGSKF